ncbi:hypothetical protein FA95DRAFT_1105693 [Auriscalpium vulgare]|uniref:Uncharacterized protein n=1 Tax=Auriscalpium vulgare TaxID=40419 RepID=A0ACB8RVL4_9AGAM|nr:hypothetical protein FA95DRAFT_1105693 [Auriscalpium vulgare]
MLSTIKNIVAAPLAWLQAHDSDPQLTPGKRRRPRHNAHDPHDDDARPRPAPKRIRRHSPPRDSPVRSKTVTAGYLDPPPLRTPRVVRHTVSPLAPRVRPTLVPRTMSMDPPSFRSMDIREPSLLPLPISRDVSMEAPAPAATFRLRSRTPQPPPLATLQEHPVFVRPPPQDHIGTTEPTVTLGSLIDKTAPATRHSTLVIASNAEATRTSPTPLHELDIYRTPLVPTRLRSATPAPTSTGTSTDTTLPSLFQSRSKARSLVLMRRSANEAKPRLGHAAKIVNIMPQAVSPKDPAHAKVDKTRKPYAGEGGLKKLLARRRQEEEDEREKEEKQVQGEQRRHL